MTATALLSRLLPWTDRAGRVSGWKLAAFIAAVLPGLWLGWLIASGGGGPKPVTFAIHDTGTWALWFLIATLAITPLRRIGNWPKLILARRLLGLTALAYSVIHLGLYVVDQHFDLGFVVREIALRAYLTIGFVATLGLLALGLTSTDGAIRRLGSNWNRLHKLVYPIAALGVLHGFMQAKSDVAPATLMAGLFVLLMLYRAAHASRFGLTRAGLPIVAAMAGAATMAIEYAWYALATGIPAHLVLAANFEIGDEPRPAMLVGLIGLAIAALGGWRMRGTSARPRRRGDVRLAACDTPRTATTTG